MQTIERFILPDVPECTVELPQGLKLIDAATEVGIDLETDDEIRVYYMDTGVDLPPITLTWYVLGLGMEVPDAFPGQFFKRVEMSDGSLRFLFFKMNPTKRDPIVAKVPGAKKKGGGKHKSTGPR